MGARDRRTGLRSRTDSPPTSRWFLDGVVNGSHRSKEVCPAGPPPAISAVRPLRSWRSENAGGCRGFRGGGQSRFRPATAALPAGEPRSLAVEGFEGKNPYGVHVMCSSQTESPRVCRKGEVARRSSFDFGCWRGSGRPALATWRFGVDCSLPARSRAHLQGDASACRRRGGRWGARAWGRALWKAYDRDSSRGRPTTNRRRRKAGGWRMLESGWVGTRSARDLVEDLLTETLKGRWRRVGGP